MINLFFQYVANFCIKKKQKISYRFFFNFFKFFITKKIILDFSFCKFYAYPKKKDLSRWMIRNLQIWDKENIELISNIIKEKKYIFLDIGCNYGAYSIPIAKNNNDVDVYCFDPSKDTLKRLEENIKLNNIQNITYFDIGIGETEKYVFFDDNIKNFKNSGSFQINNSNLGKKIKINSIDNLINQNFIKPNKNIIIKMDIEGYEFYALQGLQETINKFDVIIFFEFSKKIIENHKNLEKDLLKFIQSNNFKIYDKKFNKKNLHQLFIDIKKLSNEHEVLDNFILTKKTINKIADF
jgi:FkbM family methyltransferase